MEEHLGNSAGHEVVMQAKPRSPDLNRLHGGPDLSGKRFAVVESVRVLIAERYDEGDKGVPAYLKPLAASGRFVGRCERVHQRIINQSLFEHYHGLIINRLRRSGWPYFVNELTTFVLTVARPVKTQRRERRFNRQ